MGDKEAMGYNPMAFYVCVNGRMRVCISCSIGRLDAVDVCRHRGLCRFRVIANQRQSDLALFARPGRLDAPQYLGDLSA